MSLVRPSAPNVMRDSRKRHFHFTSTSNDLAEWLQNDHFMLGLNRERVVANCTWPAFG